MRRLSGGFRTGARAVALARKRPQTADLLASDEHSEADHLVDALERYRPANVERQPRFAGGDDEGGGPDGSPFTPPKSFQSATGGQGGAANYFPTSQGQCSSNFGSNVKVNVNCLNVSDPDLQGRGQANNEESIAQDPNNTRHIVASDNNYIRGDGTCGAHYSLDGGKTWADSTVPNGFTRGAPFGNFAREYWQAGGDTSVAWDTRGNAYLSCQLFNRGTVASPNPDQSSAFVIFRSTQNDGASWNFPGRYTTVFNDTAGIGRGARGQGADDRRQQRGQPVPRPHLRDVDRVRRRRYAPTSTRSTPTTTARRSAIVSCQQGQRRSARTRSDVGDP